MSEFFREIDRTNCNTNSISIYCWTCIRISDSSASPTVTSVIVILKGSDTQRKGGVMRNLEDKDEEDETHSEEGRVACWKISHLLAFLSMLDNRQWLWLKYRYYGKNKLRVPLGFLEEIDLNIVYWLKYCVKEIKKTI